MTNLSKVRASDLPALVDRINKYSIGLDDYFDRLADPNGTQNSYPPYNLVQVSNVEYRLELCSQDSQKKMSKFTQNMDILLSMGRKKVVNIPQNTSIEDHLNDLSPELGIYQIRRKLDQLHLRMGYFQ